MPSNIKKLAFRQLIKLARNQNSESRVDYGQVQKTIEVAVLGGISWHGAFLITLQPTI